MGRQSEYLREHRLLRHLAVVLAFVGILGQLSSFTHMFLVQHTMCPEHGELIHDRNVVERRVVEPATVVSPSIQKNSDRPIDHGHDHCWLAAHRRQDDAFTAPEGSAWRLSVGSLPAASLQQRVVSVSTIRLLDLAPKNSPPA